MAQPSTFYDYAYSWHGVRYSEILNTLLKSSHHIMNKPSCESLGEFIGHVMQQHQLDGYYRLEVCGQLFIEHFQDGRHVVYQGNLPQKGSSNHTVKVVELEHAIIFKMRFIQLYLTKKLCNAEVLEDTRDLWLLWLMHIESLCLQLSLEHQYKADLNHQEFEHASRMNFHIDLKVNLTRLERKMKDMYQEFDEKVMSLLNPCEHISPVKQQQLLICALTSHQKKLSELIKHQLGLFLSSERLLKAIKPH